MSARLARSIRRLVLPVILPGRLGARGCERRRLVAATLVSHSGEAAELVDRNQNGGLCEVDVGSEVRQ